MPGSVGLPVIDTMICFPREDSAQDDVIMRQTRDTDSPSNMGFPAVRTFRNLPRELAVRYGNGGQVLGLDGASA